MNVCSELAQDRRDWAAVIKGTPSVFSAKCRHKCMYKLRTYSRASIVLLYLAINLAYHCSRWSRGRLVTSCELL